MHLGFVPTKRVVFAPKGHGSPSPGQRPGEADRPLFVLRANGPMFRLYQAIPEIRLINGMK